MDALRTPHAVLGASIFLVAVSTASAQLDCGIGAAPGAETNCTTDGFSVAQMNGVFSLHSPEGGVTRLRITSSMVADDENLAFPVTPMRGEGDGAIELVVERHLRRSLDFSGSNGNLTVLVRAATPDPSAPGGLHLGDAVLGGGNDRIVIDSGAILTFGAIRNSADLHIRSVDFGAGENAVVNRGYFLAGDARVPDVPTQANQRGTGQAHAHDITLDNLQRFENYGDIVLGATLVAPSFRTGPQAQGRDLPLTDTIASTSLALPGAHFMGGAGSRIHIDAVFSFGVAQLGCSDRDKALRPAVLPSRGKESGVTPALVGADCLNLTEGRTSGVTELVIHDELPGNLAANLGDAGIALVDVKGGESAAEHFVLSPQSQHFDVDTGTLQQGFFSFPLVYDGDKQQHKLVSLPGKRALALPHVAQSLQAVGRATSADEFGAAGSSSEKTSDTWIHLTTTRQDRTRSRTLSAYNVKVPVDSSYDISTTALTAGRAWDYGRWTTGGSLSYVEASVSFDASGIQAEFGGVSTGLLSRYSGDLLVFENLLQVQWMEMDLSDPTLVLNSRGSKLAGYGEISRSSAYRRQIGAASTQMVHLRSELGVNFDIGDRVRIEPLLGWSWVRAEIGEVSFRSYDDGAATNQFFGDHADSLRATVGGRAAFTRSGARLNLRATGSLRYWQSLKDKTTVTLANAGPDLVVQDDFDGGWTEVNAGLELASPSGRVAGQLEAQALLGDYEGYGVTAGVRFQW